METVVEQWVAALRSGKYQQTSNTLHDDVGYCCLGVLCDLYQQAHPSMAMWEKLEDLGWAITVGGSSERLALPPEVQEWTKLRTRRGNHSAWWEDEEYIGLSLSYLNDTGTPFHMIADIIESAPEGLFKEES